ncbi:hypothetical protein MHU86_4068 [Fragilaria crotonensis]|nr:hypothetical protein MHU86_4068 [Fragilaria crotonensis]
MQSILVCFKNFKLIQGQKTISQLSGISDCSQVGFFKFHFLLHHHNEASVLDFSAAYWTTTKSILVHSENFELIEGHAIILKLPVNSDSFQAGSRSKFHPPRRYDFEYPLKTEVQVQSIQNGAQSEQGKEMAPEGSVPDVVTTLGSNRSAAKLQNQ